MPKRTATEALDPVFVYDADNDAEFWSNKQFFQAEDVRKQQEFMDANPA